MKRWVTRTLVVLVAVALVIGCRLLQHEVLEPRRQELLGRRTPLVRTLMHVAEYDAARAAGEQPRFVPGERSVGLSDLPGRAAALSLGGLRGFLAIYLWVQAETSKNLNVHEDLLDRYYRIANLQPESASVWDFHAWNLAWNLSVQWSNVERRWEWIHYGIEFLEEGIRRNPTSVNLLETMGRIYSQRIAENSREEDREYFTARVLEEEGQSPLRVAYKWYKLARQMQDETGESHSTLSKKYLHQRPCLAAHEYAKELTRQALGILEEAGRLQTDRLAEDAGRQLATGRGILRDARQWWTKTVEEWTLQLTQYPDDYNARQNVSGAGLARREVDELLAGLNQELLKADAHSFLVRVRSGLGYPLLVKPYIYDEEPPEAYHGP